ncbi:MAG TPA: alpha/beta hydrolase [Chloroflexota bacterium]
MSSRAQWREEIMPLDPKAKAFLDQWNAAMAAADPPPPPLDEMPVGDVRGMFKGALLEWEGSSEPIAKREARTIPGPGGELPVRVYTPAGAGPYPVLVYFHGGGWVIGDLDTHDGVCRALANGADCVVVSVDYRLAPEHRYPAAAEDCYAATVWVAEHARELGADSSRIAVAGDSAGGNLAAVVDLMARDRGGPPLVHQLLVYPVTDHRRDTASYREFADGYLLDENLMAYFWKQYLSGESDGRGAYASPLRAPDLAGLPPALVITAEFDPLRDEGEAYAARLREAGVPVTLSRYDGVPHGFFSMAAVLDQARSSRDEATAALRAAFARQKVA